MADVFLAAFSHYALHLHLGSLWLLLVLHFIVGVVGAMCCPACLFQADCSLHIHSTISARNGVVPQLPASDPGAPGLIIAHGKSAALCLHESLLTLNLPSLINTWIIFKKKIFNQDPILYPDDDQCYRVEVSDGNFYSG